MLVVFSRLGNRVVLERPNLRYRADGADAHERRAVDESFASSVLWAGAVGFTRVYLGVHWLSDVLAGWASGAALAFTGVTVLSLVLDRRTRRRDTAPA